MPEVRVVEQHPQFAPDLHDVARLLPLVSEVDLVWNLELASWMWHDRGSSEDEWDYAPMTMIDAIACKTLEVAGHLVTGAAMDTVLRLAACELAIYPEAE
jgi:hypothetical protein